MIVAVAHHAHAKAFVERVVQQPFERAPGRVDLDRALDTGVMRVFDVGVASADMGDDPAVLVRQELEQLVRGVDGLGRGRAFHQNMG